MVDPAWSYQLSRVLSKACLDRRTSKNKALLLRHLQCSAFVLQKHSNPLIARRPESPDDRRTLAVGYRPSSSSSRWSPRSSFESNDRIFETRYQIRIGPLVRISVPGAPKLNNFFYGWPSQGGDFWGRGRKKGFREVKINLVAQLVEFYIGRITDRSNLILVIRPIITCTISASIAFIQIQWCKQCFLIFGKNNQLFNWNGCCTTVKQTSLNLEDLGVRFFSLYTFLKTFPFKAISQSNNGYLVA